MRAGRLEQLGPPAEVYRSPATPFVADFVGLSNRLPGRVVDGDASRCSAPGCRWSTGAAARTAR